MSRTITPPTARIPVGVLTINGQQFDVRQHPEFTRFFFDLFTRVGNTAALSNTELEALLMSLDDAAGRIDALGAMVAEMRQAVGNAQASEMVMQRPQVDSLMPDVMQAAAADSLAHETTFYG